MKRYLGLTVGALWLLAILSAFSAICVVGIYSCELSAESGNAWHRPTYEFNANVFRWFLGAMGVAMLITIIVDLCRGRKSST